MFTEKCLEILSRKKVTKTSDKHRDKMRQMMDSIIEKYKSNLEQKVSKSKVESDPSQISSKTYNKLTAYEDKI